MSKQFEKNNEPTRQGIGSLEIGLKILNLIAQSPHPLTLKNLSDKLEHSSSRLHKYLVSLLRMGYIAQSNGNSYSLGKASLTLGIAAIRRIDPIRLAFEAVDILNKNTDKTVSVTIWNGQAPLVIKWLDSSRPVAVNVRLGTELSPFYSASGRIFLANMPENRRLEIIDTFYENPPALPRHRGKVMHKEAFNEHLDSIRDNNICSFYGDFLPDINVIGSAIYDINGQISSVVSLMGMANDSDVEPNGYYYEMIKTCTHQVTEEICGQRANALASTL